MSVSLLLLTNIISCALTPKRQDSAVFAEWEARALVKDKKNSKTILVNVDFSAQRDVRYRMDVTTPMGIHVTSLVLEDKKATYIVPQKKIYYSGVSGANTFSGMMNLNLDPKILMNVLFDMPFKGTAWVCTNDKNGFVSQCTRSTDKLKVNWLNRVGSEKTVQVQHPEFEIEMKFHKFKEVSEIKETLFQIKQPEGFKKI